MTDVNIMTVIDTKAIYDDHKSEIPDHNDPRAEPIGLGSGAPYIYMVCDNAYAFEGEGTSELTVKVNSGDDLRWRFVPFDYGQELSIIVVDFPHSYDADGYAKPDDYLNPYPPKYTQNTLNVYHPRDASRLDSDYDPSQIVDGYFQSNVKTEPPVGSSPAKICYQCKFLLVDRLGLKQGCYSWDPFIRVI